MAGPTPTREIAAPEFETPDQTAASGATAPVVPARSGGVLVVEDDPEVNELVGAYVRLAGFEYRAALDGASAIDAVRRQSPAVIVLDLMLPDFDGFEVCRRVRRELGETDVAVIFLTALDNAAARAKCQECGAAEYLTKPFDPDRLIESIAKHGGEKRTIKS